MLSGTYIGNAGKALLHQRIQCGIKKLVEHDPEWVKKVDPNTLDMSNETDCVLGQIYGDLMIGMEVLGLKWAGWLEVVQYGFGTMRKEDHLYISSDLTQAWKEELKKLNPV